MKEEKIVKEFKEELEKVDKLKEENEHKLKLFVRKEHN